ncbi:MAG: AAA family ATPase [Actinobacteria bacterium]|nr:AAA family ATPase [Actinomycetota bacterium]
MQIKTILFHGGKGGVGTTTLAAETAGSLSRRRRRVAAVDLDIFGGDLHYRLDLPLSRGTHTLADLLPVLDEVDGRILDNALSTCGCGARLLPSPASSAAAGFVEERHIKKVLHALAREFDYVIVDTPCSLDRVTAAALDASGLVVLVITPELACLGGAKKALVEMETLGMVDHQTALVVNRSLDDADLFTVRDIESFLSLPVNFVLPEDTIMCRRAGDEGRLLTSEHSRLSQAVEELVDRII